VSEAAGPPAAIETTDLTKRFGAIQAVDRLTLRVADGESVALFGPNGAGKTTLIRILTLALRASDGSFRIAGLDPRREDLEIRRRIGVISHHSYLYDDLTARQNLEFFGRIYGVERPGERARTARAGRARRARRRRGRHVLARDAAAPVARPRLVHEPRIVFLDEPFTGLDPHGARTLSGTLERLRQERRTVVMVTHNLTQGLELAERWLILARGRVVDQGRSADVDPRSFEREYFERLELARPRRVPA